MCVCVQMEVSPRTIRRSVGRKRGTLAERMAHGARPQIDMYPEAEGARGACCVSVCERVLAGGVSSIREVVDYVCLL